MSAAAIVVAVLSGAAAAFMFIGSAVCEAARTIEAAPRVTAAQQRAETNLRLREIAAHEWPTDPILREARS